MANKKQNAKIYGKNSVLTDKIGYADFGKIIISPILCNLFILYNLPILHNLHIMLVSYIFYDALIFSQHKSKRRLAEKGLHMNLFCV